MLIYGYTSEKNVVLVEVAIDRIVAEGIDPCRLDLFDPDPVRLKFQIGPAEQNLQFRKLTEITFAYQTTDQRIFLCMLNGLNPTCVWSDQWTKTFGSPLLLKNVRASHSQFNSHLAEYLEQISRPGARRVTTLSEPVFGRQVEMRGSDLIFTYSVLPEITTGIAVGHMFDQLSTKTPLPKQIDWVLAELKQWNPVVTGPAVRQALTGKTPAIVHCVIDWLGLLPMMRGSKHLPDWARNSGWEFGFRHEDCLYLCTGTWEPGQVKVSRPKISGYSADWLCVTEPDVVSGPRIAFFDLGRSQTRPLGLAPGGLDPHRLPAYDVATLLKEDGLTVVAGLPHHDLQPTRLTT